MNSPAIEYTSTIHKTHQRHSRSSVPIYHYDKGTFTYLGSQNANDPNRQSQYDHYQLQLNRHLYAICHRLARSTAKYAYYNMLSFPD